MFDKYTIGFALSLVVAGISLDIGAESARRERVVMRYYDFGRVVAAANTCPGVALSRDGAAKDMVAAAPENARWKGAMVAGSGRFADDYAAGADTACAAIVRAFPRLLRKG